MKKPWRYLYPGLFGLLVYATIRVINDTVSYFKFWNRPWTINAIEIISFLFIGYALYYAMRRLFSRYDKILATRFHYKTILMELLWTVIITQVGVNLVITPMAALTDDGLSWGDVATINIIPLMFVLIFYGISRSRHLLQAYVDSRLQLEKVSKDHLQTELKFLRAQYHPHFLFNALNTIYFQMDEDVEAAKRTVERFSDLLRYQLYDQQKTVSLKQEIDYLKNFIDIQKVRSPERLDLSTRFDSTLNGQQVYPLLLLPLVENAFKYVGGDYRIHIEGRQEGQIFVFFVENSVPGYGLLKKKPGIGLENLRRRLELLYPGKHRLETGPGTHGFRARLELDLS